MKPGGETRVWDGTYFASSTCGAGMACVNEACVEAGRYVARMCAHADPDGGATAPPYCDPVQTPTCVDVPFEWPPDGGVAAVTGVIGTTPTR